MHWHPVTTHRFKLAEGPFWDSPTQALYFVDIAGRQACRLSEHGLERWQLTEPVSAFIPTERGDALVTLASGLYRLDLCSPTDRPELHLFSLVDPVAGNRANESRCDAQGRLWLGTMQNNLGPAGEDIPVTRSSGGLFRIAANVAGGAPEVTRLLEGIGIANTLEWSADSHYLYTADSLAGQLYRYRLNAAGELGGREPWAADGPGVPDGSALDSQGYLWNARWGAGCLLRFAPDGSLDQRIDVPVSHPTSCVFGGPDLSTLYVTSAQPATGATALDGGVFSTQVGVTGRPCHRFVDTSNKSTLG
jgi:sugar lactone lactonase YvrE